MAESRHGACDGKGGPEHRPRPLPKALKTPLWGGGSVKCTPPPAPTYLVLQLALHLPYALLRLAFRLGNERTQRRAQRAPLALTQPGPETAGDENC